MAPGSYLPALLIQCVPADVLLYNHNLQLIASFTATIHVLVWSFPVPEAKSVILMQNYQVAGASDGDGQYYLTKWMFALSRMALAKEDRRYNDWAIELAKVPTQ